MNVHPHQAAMICLFLPGGEGHENWRICKAHSESKYDLGIGDYYGDPQVMRRWKGPQTWPGEVGQDLKSIFWHEPKPTVPVLKRNPRSA